MLCYKVPNNYYGISLRKPNSQVQVQKFQGCKRNTGSSCIALQQYLNLDPGARENEDKENFLIRCYPLKITLQPQDQHLEFKPAQIAAILSVLMGSSSSWLMILLALRRKIHQNNKNGDQENENVYRIKAEQCWGTTTHFLLYCSSFPISI